MKALYKITLDLRHPETHRAQVKLQAPQGQSLPEYLRFPAWTPGSYLVRDYARHVTRLTHAKKTNKNTWQLEKNVSHVEYEVYGFERTVRTSFIDNQYIALIGASLAPLLHGPFEVHLLLPKHWSFVSSALHFKKVAPGHWRGFARDDDHWIDSPIVAAAPGFGGQGSFSFRGVKHHITWVGTECTRSMTELERDFKKIAEACYKLFGGMPFSEYWFLLHFAAKLYGGLEHRDSQLSQFDGGSLAENKDYDNFLRLIAHEYFHAWNVKSLRPRALGPFDYDKENYTEDLWFAEGLTDYFDDMIPAMAGLIPERKYWEAKIESIQRLNDGLPAQKRRSVAESSFDAWIRYYKGDEDSDNTDVSYYIKGGLLGWCWDAELRRKTQKRWTLAKLMRAFWKEFGIDAETPLLDAKPGYTRAELFAFAKKTTKVSHDFVEDWVTMRKPLPWRNAAKTFQVKYHEKISDLWLHHLGLQFQWRGTQAFVQKVLSGSAAESAGIAAGDEILSLNGWRVTDNERLQSRWRRALASKQKVELQISRLERLQTIRIQPRKHEGLGMSLELR